jgi:hypothetical protein
MMQQNFGTGWVAMVVLILSWPAIGCDTRLPTPRFAYGVESVCPPPESDSYFLRDEIPLGTTDSVTQFLRDQFTAYLRLADASPIGCGSGPNETYRILRIGRPAEAGVIVTLVAEHDGWSVSRTDFERPHPYTELSVRQRSKYRLSGADGETLVLALARAGFWDAPPERLPPIDDGTVWLLEGRQGKGYLALPRRLRDGEPLQEAAEAILAATNAQ